MVFETAQAIMSRFGKLWAEECVRWHIDAKEPGRSMSFVKGFMGKFSMHVRDYRATDRASCLVVFESNVPKFFAPSERRDFEVFLNALPGPYLVTEDEAGAICGCGGYAVSLGTATADLC